MADTEIDVVRRAGPADCYDVIVCGSGSSGSVVARRLAENPDVRVLLLEAGGSDQISSVMEATRWAENLGSATDWGFAAEPGPEVNGRSIPMSMGKVLGGGSSINVMAWSRGHQRDWDQLAEQLGDPAWSYRSVLDIFRRIEDWRGKPDPRRGIGGPAEVSPAGFHSAAAAMIDAARFLGIPTFESPNGAMMEAVHGCSYTDVRVKNGQRLSVFDSYVRPILHLKNLTVLTEAVVHRVLFDKKRAVGVEILFDGRVHRIAADEHVVLSTGAINTPKILMHSGIGDADELERLDLPVVEHLPGVGHNLQDHTCFCTVWSYANPIPVRDNGSAATLFGRSDAGLAAPDLLLCQAQFPFCSPEIASHGVPQSGWTMVAGLAQPKSRGSVRLRGADPRDAPIIRLNALSHPDDLRTARAAVELSREIGAQQMFARLGMREAIPGVLRETDAEDFIRNSAMSFWHQSCTARMGRDSHSVVGSDLKVHGLEGLTIADASVFPRIPTGNIMAPCVVVGERAGEILSAKLRGISVIRALENGPAAVPGPRPPAPLEA
jgi:choline dehydrogenase